MPTLVQLADLGSSGRIEHSFPCVTWPSQCNVLTGTTADQHGVVANGFFWRDSGKVEMWTAWNEVIQRPQIWDTIKNRQPNLKTAAWFPMLAKGCGADIVCMPAPIHQPDGSEDMWCYTKPQEFYGTLLDELEHFPLHHFWGPLAGIQSSKWIVDSAIRAAQEFSPDVWYIYLPHLDYAAQKSGPDSDEAGTALTQLDGVLNQLVNRFENIYPDPITWLVISEYVITPVDHVSFPNRLLREAGLLVVMENNGLDQLDFESSDAWALVDHQFSHVFVKDRRPDIVAQVENVFDGQQGFQIVLSGDARKTLNLDHERSGDVILVSTPSSWQAYYWWLDDNRAPEFARTVDIHRKPGYDPVELFFDPATKSIPLQPGLVKGSHGAPATDEHQRGAIVCNQPLLKAESIRDTDIHDLVIDAIIS